MNLHEDCLITYLKKPDELSHATDVLKLNNKMLEKKMVDKLFLAKLKDVNYTVKK